jgi:3-hydroxyacyl-[acyl-carrier-protein] dehydratase
MSADAGAPLITGTVYFDPDEEIYRDHFPGRPVVPGTLILQGFLAALAGHGLKGQRLAVESLRFKRFLSPGAYTYCIRLTRGGARCALMEAGGKAAVGTLVLGAD